jgi:hypothetical protein
MADDFIEADGGVHNIRVFENRGFNAYHAALSAQPIFGGPVYFIKNICYNVPGTALKYTVRPSGILTYHNTFIADVGIANFSNGHFRNNLFLGWDERRPVLSGTTFTTYSSLDYNGYAKKNISATNFRWRYPTHDSLNHVDEKQLKFFEFNSLKEFRKSTGFESHGIEVDPLDLMNVPMPDASQKGLIYQSAGYDFRLRPKSKAIDAGVVLPNINDNFSGKAPDMGALEREQPVPVYGPRN